MKRKIIKPFLGWKSQTWYLVEVAYNEYNPIHRDLFYTGFLNGKEEGFLPVNWKMSLFMKQRLNTRTYLSVLIY